MPIIRLHYGHLDDKGHHGTTKSTTGDEDPDMFDFVSTKDDGEEDGWLDSDIQATDGSSEYSSEPIIVTSYQTGGSSTDDYDVMDTAPLIDEWIG